MRGKAGPPFGQKFAARDEPTGEPTAEFARGLLNGGVAPGLAIRPNWFGCWLTLYSRLIGILYSAQLAGFWPPVAVPPTIGAMTGGVKNGLLDGHTDPAVAGAGHLWNCAKLDTTSTQLER